MHTKPIQITEASSEEDYTLGRLLFMQYAEHLGFPLDFQKFEDELAHLQSMYARPKGVLLLAKQDDGQTLGCVAVRPLEPKVAELKRMYVTEQCRGNGAGKKLLQSALAISKTLGYDLIRLDTLSSMLPAIHLYREAGFYEIPAYCYNPFDNAMFFEKKITN
ncbi:putative acetyltransferase [Catalinimonas alkaloidigena]|uniref:GNAT family N-acetyltransferase n=1 Tax=Catalinimonas alkaloidigena TaxID=1075417 RepID=UPI002405AF3A|nr:GNAT family N-acetyltransferase [Catalinimonas alkaloidigena]MDF9795887.1 putative acetyltransferase [Catalinimonas alkaloidigena]